MNEIEKNNEHKNTIHTFVLGETGIGKSTLSNTMTGKVNDFKENSEPECETKITFGLYGTFDNFKTFVIDTPRSRRSR